MTKAQTKIGVKAIKTHHEVIAGLLEGKEIGRIGIEATVCVAGNRKTEMSGLEINVKTIVGHKRIAKGNPINGLGTNVIARGMPKAIECNP